MCEKKEPYKFTLRFNFSDPTHQQITVLLNRQGRRKAQFLVNAVMHYIHCSQTPDIPQPPPIDTELIETIVRKILKEQSEEPQIKKAEKHHPPTAQAPEDDFSFDEAAAALGTDDLAAIANTMAMFSASSTVITAHISSTDISLV